MLLLLLDGDIEWMNLKPILYFVGIAKFIKRIQAVDYSSCLNNDQKKWSTHGIFGKISSTVLTRFLIYILEMDSDISSTL